MIVCPPFKLYFWLSARSAISHDKSAPFPALTSKPPLSWMVGQGLVGNMVRNTWYPWFGFNMTWKWCRQDGNVRAKFSILGKNSMASIHFKKNNDVGLYVCSNMIVCLSVYMSCWILLLFIFVDFHCWCSYIIFIIFLLETAPGDLFIEYSISTFHIKRK